MLQSVKGASVTLFVVHAQRGQQLEDLLLHGDVAGVEGRRQLPDVLGVLDDEVQADARIHDGTERLLQQERSEKGAA